MSVVFAAEGVLDAFHADRVDKFGPNPNGAHYAKNGEHKVPGDERTSQLELLALLHVLLRRKNEYDVE